MTYKETKKAVKDLIVKRNGLSNITGYDIVALYELGANGTDVQNAMSYFRYSKQAKRFLEKTAL